jgi:hypothetical protein
VDELRVEWVRLGEHPVWIAQLSPALLTPGAAIVFWTDASELAEQTEWGQATGEPTVLSPGWYSCGPPDYRSWGSLEVKAGRADPTTAFELATEALAGWLRQAGAIEPHVTVVGIAEPEAGA